ncbi:MAG: phosphatidate cytidylyltransferase [Blastocatellia bacterium]
MAIVAVLALLEYKNIAAQVGAQVGIMQSVLAALGVLAGFYWQQPEWIMLSLALLVIVELSVQLFTTKDLTKALPNAAGTIFGVAYIALLGGYLLALRVAPEQANSLPAKLISLFFLIVFAGDTGAYYTGRTLGKHKLAPSISPGKTVEGLLGGLLANVLAVVIARYTFFPELSLISAIPLSLLMGGLGVIGDLCESMLKRGSHVKDAAHLIPGHGGVLDRLDSILFNAPVLYYYFVLFVK